MEVAAKTGYFFETDDGPNCPFDISADSIFAPTTTPASTLPTYNLKTSFGINSGVPLQGFVQDIQSMSNIDLYHHVKRTVPFQFEIVTPFNSTTQSFTSRILDAEMLTYLIMTSSSPSPKDVVYDTTMDRNKATIFTFRPMGSGKYACTIMTEGVELALVYGQIIDQSTFDQNNGSYDLLNATVYGQNGLGTVSGSFVTYPIASIPSTGVVIKTELPQLVCVMDGPTQRALQYDPIAKTLSLVPYPFLSLELSGTAFTLNTMGNNCFNLGIPGVMSLMYSSPTGTWVPDADGHVQSMLLYNSGAPLPLPAMPAGTQTTPVTPFDTNSNYLLIGDTATSDPIMFQTINTSPIYQVKLKITSNDITGYIHVDPDYTGSNTASEADATVFNVVTASSDNTKYTIYAPDGTSDNIDLGYYLGLSASFPSALTVQVQTSGGDGGVV